MIRTFYHYTTKSALNNIVNTQRFTPSYLEKTLDSTFGEGHYFTDLPPESSDIILTKTLWLKEHTEKINAFIAFEIDDSILEKCTNRRSVYRLPLGVVQGNDINISLVYNLPDSNKTAIKYKHCAFRQRKGSNISTDKVWKIFGIIAIVGIAFVIINELSKLYNSKTKKIVE
jgi:hypothetical protein